MCVCKRIYICIYVCVCYSVRTPAQRPVSRTLLVIRKKLEWMVVLIDFGSLLGSPYLHLCYLTTYRFVYCIGLLQTLIKALYCFISATLFWRWLSNALHHTLHHTLCTTMPSCGDFFLVDASQSLPHKLQRLASTWWLVLSQTSQHKATHCCEGRGFKLMYGIPRLRWFYFIIACLMGWVPTINSNPLLSTMCVDSGYPKDTDLRVKFLLKTESGYLKDAEVTWLFASSTLFLGQNTLLWKSEAKHTL